MLSSNTARMLRLRLAMEEHKTRVGARIKQARDAKGWSQTQLARAIDGSNIDGASISRYERGQVLPRPKMLDALALALDVDTSYFLVAAPAADETADLMGALSPSDGERLARVEAKLDAVLDAISDLATGELEAALLAARQQAQTQQHQRESDPASPGPHRQHGPGE